MTIDRYLTGAILRTGLLQHFSDIQSKRNDVTVVNKSWAKSFTWHVFQLWHQLSDVEKAICSPQQRTNT
jgi:hypothetical protein